MKLSDEQRHWLSLSLIPGVGTARFVRLLARFQRPEAVLRASRAQLEEVVGPKLADRIAAYGDMVDLERQLHLMREYDAHVITLEDTGYPLRLAEIYDPPLVLYVRGALLERDEAAVAVVGTRKPSAYGERMAERFGRELAARGITVISGLAEGVDAAAHRGALQGGGRTIAVLGCGVDVVYPKSNADLMHAIMRQGAVVSQFSMSTQPSPGHFPFRNRIISGMSLGTLVVECPLRSGALITARQAAEQGREVFAIPGRLEERNSQGPHALMREGAKLVETVEDILLELELPVNLLAAAPVASASDEVAPEEPQIAPQKAPLPGQSEEERKVLEALRPDGSFVDEIASACRLPVSAALSLLTMLELKGLIRQFSGKRFAPK